MPEEEEVPTTSSPPTSNLVVPSLWLVVQADVRHLSKVSSSKRLKRRNGVVVLWRSGIVGGLEQDSTEAITSRSGLSCPCLARLFPWWDVCDYTDAIKVCFLGRLTD